MRPGRAPRIRSAGVCTGTPPGCFNEAGARAPRILIDRSDSWCKHTKGFNEAGARAPRIRGSKRSRLRSRRCFNEAGARAPRILCELASRQIALRASMRPGRARPGYSLIGRIVGASTPRASMRPGRARPGYIRTTEMMRDALEASMRPGRARPGYADQNGRDCDPGAASMRPGRARPGYLT